MNLLKPRYIVPLVICLTLAYFIYTVFRTDKEKLGEVTFYKDNNIELKIVLIHVNIPLHYNGNRYTVACRSEQTNIPTNDKYEWDSFMIEEGWNHVPDSILSSGPGDDPDVLLAYLAEQAKKHHSVNEQGDVLVKRDDMNFLSTDRCRSFREQKPGVKP